MPGHNLSATDIDIGFRLLGPVERLLLRRRISGPFAFTPSLGLDDQILLHPIGEAEHASRWLWEEDETRECGLNLKSGRLVRAGA
jgi:hypothetical protein